MKKQVTRPPIYEQSELIDRLGGAKKVAGMLSRRTGDVTSPQSVSNWRRRGIPFRFRAAMALEAGERGVGVPGNFLGEQPPASALQGNEVPYL